MEIKEATVEDQKAFASGLDELLNKLGLVLSLQIIKKGISFKGEGEKIETGFIDSPILTIQKKVIEAEVIKDEPNTTSA